MTSSSCRKSISLFLQIVFIIFLSSLFSLVLLKDIYFSSVNLEQILFHLYAPLKGSPTDLSKFLPHFLALFLCSTGSLFFLKYKKPKIFTATCLILAALNVILLEITFGVSEYISNQFQLSEFIEQNYVNPKKIQITFPKRKKNLIFILAESLETTFQDIKNGGSFQKNYIPELTALAHSHLNFSHTNKQEGAEVFSNSGWTIAGMVAQLAGIPLKTYGNSFNDGGNEMSSVVSFLPGVWALGDILNQNGYRNVFIAGSDTTFAGKNLFMSQHGNYEIYDKPKMEEEFKRKFEIVHDRIIADSELLPIAQKKISALAQEKEPFHVLLLTGDTHMLGYLGNDCPKSIYEEKKQIEKSYKCADYRLKEFVDWIMKQPFYEDTTIVIVGDHCNMLSFDAILNGEEREEYVLYSGNNRKVYNAFINTDTPVFQSHNRKFSTLDMYPTILASIGAKIEGDRLGLGTNLFSNKRTLLEKYSYDFIEQEFKKKSLFYMKHLWGK